jgi:hypothetical protein
LWSSRVTSVADPDNFDADPDPTSENKPDPDPTPEKNADQYPSFSKNFLETFCQKKFFL